MQGFRIGNWHCGSGTLQLSDIVYDRWATVRCVFHGLKIAWVSVASVVLGALLFISAEPVHDLFLEVKGRSALESANLSYLTVVLRSIGFWLFFYVSVMVAWGLPVYVCSRWVLWRVVHDPEKDWAWVRRYIPAFLAVSCFGAVMLGQLMALSNAPTVVTVEDAKRVHIATVKVNREVEDFYATCNRNGQSGCNWSVYAQLIAPASKAFAYGVARDYGTEVVVLVAYCTIGILLVWLLVRRWLISLPFKAGRIGAMIVWWLVTTALAVPLALALLVVTDTLGQEAGKELGLIHLVALPALTFAAAYLAWRGLRPNPEKRAAPIGRMLLRLRGSDDLSESNATTMVVNPLFYAVLLVSVVLIALPFVVHPVQISEFVYRAPMLPFLIGALVAPVTYLSYWSAYCRAPFVLAAILVISGATLFVGDTNDIRTVAYAPARETLDKTIERWAAVNGCKLGTKVKTSEDCPNPLIISAAGGASRSAFHVAGVIGKLMDDEMGHRPFAKQLFAISAVSGGALGAVVAYAAMADSQFVERASDSFRRPPCKGEHDSDWFAFYVHAESRGGPASKWKSNESWRGCLQQLVAGDFLSPVMVTLATTDLLHFRGDRGDRAAVLEQAWERRYARLTGQQVAPSRFVEPSPSTSVGKQRVESSTLAQPLTVVRQKVLAMHSDNWLPVLLLNGTSVSSGRRIVTSDIETLTRKENVVTGRLFQDAYELHDLLNKPVCETKNPACPGCDLRLSTSATMSARFPIISPHGNIRGVDGKIVDRVVDGGYFENFGAVTAMELSRALENKGLKPLIILINNEPTNTDVECVSDFQLHYPEKTRQSTFFASVMSPLNALTATRQARGSHAAVEFCNIIGDKKRFVFVTVKPEKNKLNKALPVSWWLSKHVQKYLDDQLDDVSTYENYAVNELAFATIKAARKRPELSGMTDAQTLSK